MFFFIRWFCSHKKQFFIHTHNCKKIYGGNDYLFFSQLNKNHFDHNKRTIAGKKAMLAKRIYFTNPHTKHMHTNARNPNNGNDDYNGDDDNTQRNKKTFTKFVCCKTRAKADFAMSTFDFYFCVSACLIHGNTQKIRYNCIYDNARLTIFLLYNILSAPMWLHNNKSHNSKQLVQKHSRSPWIQTILNLAETQTLKIFKLVFFLTSKRWIHIKPNNKFISFFNKYYTIWADLNMF